MRPKLSPGQIPRAGALTGWPEVPADRTLQEALATGADPHLALVFNIDHTNAMACANAARSLLSSPAEQALSRRSKQGVPVAPAHPEAGKVIRLLDWVTRQCRELGLPGPDDLALALVGAYQGMSLVASVLRGAEIMTREGTCLTHWLDALQDSKNPGPSAL